MATIMGQVLGTVLFATYVYIGGRFIKNFDRTTLNHTATNRIGFGAAWPVLTISENGRAHLRTAVPEFPAGKAYAGPAKK